MSGPDGTRHRETRTYCAGYGLSLVLTAAAFAAVYWRPFAPMATLGIVLALGLFQIVVHFHFFLHLGLKKSSREDLQIVLFSTLIIALMVSGTLVILFNLRGRMM